MTTSQDARAKHSPGPWKIGRGAWKTHVSIRKADGREHVCEISTFNENEEANARLIAASPDLLEACKAARENGRDPYEVMALLDHAILKAEGK